MKCLIFSDNENNAKEIISYFYKKMDIDVLCNSNVIDYGRIMFMFIIMVFPIIYRNI